MATKLITVAPFAAWHPTKKGEQQAYNPGDVIPTSHYTKWPEGTLTRRLQSGDVKYTEDAVEEVDDEDEEEEKKDEKKKDFDPTGGKK